MIYKEGDIVRVKYPSLNLSSRAVITRIYRDTWGVDMAVVEILAPDDGPWRLQSNFENLIFDNGLDLLFRVMENEPATPNR